MQAREIGVDESTDNRIDHEGDRRCVLRAADAPKPINEFAVAKISPLRTGTLRAWLCRSCPLRLVVLLTAGCLLVGCAVGPEYSTTSIALPARWGNDQGAALPRPPNLAQWWRRLSYAPLDKLIEQAVQGSRSTPRFISDAFGRHSA